MRIATIIAAALAGLISLGLLAAGGALLWGDSRKDDEGYLNTRTERFATDTYALATDNLDLDLDGVDDVLGVDAYGKIRLRVDSRADAPVFVGVARTTDVTRYLHGTSHALVTDISYPDFDAEYAEQPGTKRPAAPADQTFWDASAHGTGEQTLTWDVEDGDWSVVVMNADSSGGVETEISGGAEAPWLAPLGWGLTIAGLLTLGLMATAGVAAHRSRAKRMPLSANPSAL
jgi:hypothetical protein